MRIIDLLIRKHCFLCSVYKFTDKECPLYNKAVDSEIDAHEKVSPSMLVKQMEDEGFAFKRNNFDKCSDLIQSTYEETSNIKRVRNK